MGKLMDGKVGVVFGVANKRSIAWGITQALVDQGAQVCLTYQGERLQKNVTGLAQELPAGTQTIACDVTDDEQIDSVFEFMDQQYGRCDFVVHSVAFAPKAALEDSYVNTVRDDFSTALDISAYSLVRIAKAAQPLMKRSGGGSILTMTYYGSEKVVPNYNVMAVAKSALEASVRYLASDLGPDAIRVNAISAGPLNTLAARGVSGLTGMFKIHAEKAPLRRNVELHEVGNTGLFFASDLSSGITGEVLYVDCGYNIMGM